MAQLQHWIITCTTCDGPAEYHCNTCGDILCPRCREIHQRSRAREHHSIVPYTERIEPEKLEGQCGIHPDNQWMLWDQTCEIPVCTECVASADHKRHDFDKIANKIEEQRKIIQKEFDAYAKLLAQWENSLQQIQCSMEAYEKNIDELGKDITKAADIVCDQVRSLEAALRIQLQEIKNIQKALIQNAERSLTKGIARIKQKIEEAEDKLRSEDVAVLLYYKVNDKGDIYTPPESEPPPLPLFTPGSLNVQSLQVMLGSLSMEKKKETPNEEGKIKSPQIKVQQVSDDEKAMRFHKESGLATGSLSLLPAAIVKSTLQTSKDYAACVTCAGSGLAWVGTGKKVQLMDRKCSVKKNMTTGSGIAGMSTTTQGDILASDCNNRSIKSVTVKGEIQTAFGTEWKPWGLCCLQNGDVMVTFYEDGRVVQYNRTGRIVRELDKSLFRHPRNVAQNRINHHIYVCDKLSYGVGTEGKLLAVDDFTSKLLYEYTGPDTSTFTPYDVCTDQAGHVIITDYSNDRIHILDQDGRFLQYMLTKDQGLYRPFCIDTDNDGYALVSEWESKKTNQVKILKYLD